MPADARRLRWPPDAEVWRELRRHPPTAAEQVVVAVAEGDDPDPTVVATLVEALADADAVACVEPVTDAVKRTDPAGRVTGVADRDLLVRLGWPQVVRAGALVLLAEAHDAVPTGSPAHALIDMGRDVRGVPRSDPATPG